MATVTKPIALDESLHTTEQTPRNLADVLAQALQALNTTISGLNFINAVVVAELPTTGISTTTIYLVPSDDPQSENIYDEYINLDGTSAGWEKIGSTEIDLSNYYTKTETDTLLSGKVDKEVGKGLSTNDYTTAEKTKLAGIEAGAEVNPTSGIKTATESFETVDGGLLSKCMINLVPVQSGSGDPSPDNIRPISGHTEVGLLREGKNRLPLDIATIKSINTSGTWSGNEYTYRGVTFTINTDSLGNIISVNANGTASGNAILTIVNSISLNENYIVSGCPSGGSYNSSYSIWAISQSPYNEAVDSGAGVTITSNYSREIRVRIASGYNAQNLLFKPMIRLATETDSTFEPYLGNLYTVQIDSTVYGGYVDLVSGVMVATYAKVKLKDQNLVIGGTQDNLDYRLRITISPTTIMPKISGQTEKIAISDQLKSGNPWETYGTSQKKDYTISGDAGSNQLSAYCSTLQTLSDWTTFLTNNDVEACYLLATPQTIQLTPQQIETLSGQNNLSTPLSGQSIETNGVEYKELFTFADVKSYVDKKIPDAPTTDGTYTLTATVSSGVATYSWT